MSRPAARTYRIAAVDPGESWCGLAVFDLRTLRQSRLLPGEYVDQSRHGQIGLVSASTVKPEHLYRELEYLMPGLHHLVLERYSLYPWLAREQGYSELETAQCVGVVKYICSRAEVPVTLQDAKVNLKEGRAIAEKAGFRMVPRSLGSGRFKYRGPDFDLPGKPHRRDACSHGVRWSARDSRSPLVRRNE